jgi:hypothetical protein
MQSVIRIAFTLGQKIKITELKCSGFISSIWFTEAGLKYEVRYFLNGEAKSVYFYERELSE